MFTTQSQTFESSSFSSCYPPQFAGQINIAGGQYQSYRLMPVAYPSPQAYYIAGGQPSMIAQGGHMILAPFYPTPYGG